MATCSKCHCRRHRHQPTPPPTAESCWRRRVNMVVPQPDGRRWSFVSPCPRVTASVPESPVTLSPSHEPMPPTPPNPLVSVIMGSKSDWETMSPADEMLTRFGVDHECRIVSAHRTPDWLRQFATEAESRGVQVIIAGAGGAAHLPGMAAAQTILPVLGVPVQSHALNGMDSLLSIIQMPAGVPVGTLAIGRSGATNAALLAASILGLSDEKIRKKVEAFRKRQTDAVLTQRPP